MSYYVYKRPRLPIFTWLCVIVGLITFSAITTGLFVARESSSRIATLEQTISEMKDKEVYYKDIEKQFFEKKAEGVVLQKYEEQLRAKDEENTKALVIKDQEISVLSDYISELSTQTAALENTIRRQAAVSDIKPLNFNLPTKISRGSYDDLRRGASNELTTENMTYAGQWLMTMYAPTGEECGNNRGITASGKPVQPGYNIAIDRKYWKFGQKFYIEGYGVVEATDVGGGIKGRNRLDYCVLDPALARQFGSKRVKVWIVND